jgi:hypothetical protein
MLSTVYDIANTPGNNPVELASGLENLLKTGQQNEQQLAATISHPLPSDLRPAGTGITISASV